MSRVTRRLERLKNGERFVPEFYALCDGLAADPCARRHLYAGLAGDDGEFMTVDEFDKFILNHAKNGSVKKVNGNI